MLPFLVPCRQTTKQGGVDDPKIVWLAVGFAVGVSLYFFGDCLWGSEQLAFRDVGHFYTPLFEYLRFRSRDTWFPLWSPLDQFGVPLAGEPTAAIFYPPRFLLSPVGNTTQFIAGYTLLHLWWAGTGAYQLARGAGARGPSAILAAFAYPLSGCVFFLYTNPPFLVGAAWLPWIILTFTRLAQVRATGRQVASASICLAMCVLGGDPQTALHAMLMMGAHQAYCQYKQFRPRVLLLFLSTIALAALMSMPQIAAGIAWASQSHRLASQPATLFDVGVTPLIPGPQLPGSHAEHVYDFSVAPWHLAELATPHAFGSPMPINARLSKLIPGEPRMWVPTLYCGLTVFTLTLISLRRQRNWTPWLMLGIVGLGLSMGKFGVGMFVRTFAQRIGLNIPFPLNDAVGGPYWLLVSVLPGYGQFRYPAKWLTFAALGLCIHASVSLGVLPIKELTRKLRQVSFAVGLIAIVALVIICLPPVVDRIRLAVSESGQVERFWGPLDAETGLSTVRLSLLQTSCLSVILIIVSLRHADHRQRFLECVLLVTGLDMVLCGYAQLHTVPVNVEPPKPLTSNFPDRFISTSGYWDWPPRWRLESHPDRLDQVELAQRVTWFRRWYLADRVAMLNGTVSMPAAATVQFWSAAGRLSRELNVAERSDFQRSLAAYLAADAWVQRDSGAEPPSNRFNTVGDKQPWVRHHSRWSVAERQNASLLKQWMEDFRASPNRFPVVLADRPNQVQSATEDHALVRADAISEFHWTPEKIEFEINITATSLIQVMQFQDGGWKASACRLRASDAENSRESIEVLQVDHISQGFFLPPGNWRIRLTYSPSWWWPSWLAVALGATVIIYINWPNRRP